MPDGTWVQDTSEIIDLVEAAHPEAPVVPDPDTSPRQCLAAYLIALLADEWVLVPAFWPRWYFSEDGREPSHRAFNEQQWERCLRPAKRSAESISRVGWNAFSMSERLNSVIGPAP